MCSNRRIVRVERRIRVTFRARECCTCFCLRITFGRSKRCRIPIRDSLANISVGYGVSIVLRKPCNSLESSHNPNDSTICHGRTICRLAQIRLRVTTLACRRTDENLVRWQCLTSNGVSSAVCGRVLPQAIGIHVSNHMRIAVVRTDCLTIMHDVERLADADRSLVLANERVCRLAVNGNLAILQIRELEHLAADLGRVACDGDVSYARTVERDTGAIHKLVFRTIVGEYVVFFEGCGVDHLACDLCRRAADVDVGDIIAISAQDFSRAAVRNLICGDCAGRPVLVLPAFCRIIVDEHLV